MRSSFVIILIVAITIASFGISSIYSSTFQKESRSRQDIYKRQMLWAGCGLFLFYLISLVNYRQLWESTYLLYGIIVLALLAVDALGIIRLGAQRWLRIGVFNFQPSEFAKLAVVLYLARYYSKKPADSVYYAAGRRGIVRSLLTPFLIVAIPTGLIIEQPDLGSGIILLAVFTAMMYPGYVRGRYIAAFTAVLALSAPIFWHLLREYQRDRVMVFLNPYRDPLGAGYTVIQSKIAIGSGGFFGKGWLAGTQSRLHFLPESHTDFIFATFAEQWGFAGCIVLLVLFFLLLRQGIIIAHHAHDYYGRLLALGIVFMLAVQIFVNIAMNMGYVPVVGVPLPLMSYGGSSVMVTFIALGILASIGRRH